MKPSFDAAAPIAEDCEARSALLLGMPVVAKPGAKPDAKPIAKPDAGSTYAVYYTDPESAIEIAEASVVDATVDATVDAFVGVSAGSSVSAIHDAAFRVLNGPSIFGFSAEQGGPVPSRVRDALENEQFLQIHLQQLEQPRQAQPGSTSFWPM
ncbi:MAG TPA: hypothetical protein EYG46_11980 [Myxococcales bacterium]|nr:hypothetical protein [Myxococcales bacterium]HIM01700.1 hypothetical protein [Myxococcales bacterium]